jgi:hypothetical protein
MPAYEMLLDPEMKLIPTYIFVILATVVRKPEFLMSLCMPQCFSSMEESLWISISSNNGYS